MTTVPVPAIITCPHCQTRVLPSAGRCPACGQDPATPATASDRLRVAKRRKLMPRPSMVTILAGALIGMSIGYAGFVVYILVVPATYDADSGEVGRMSQDVANLLAVYSVQVVIWALNATAFLRRWRFCRVLYFVSTPLWLIAPTVLLMLDGKPFNEENVRTLLGMNIIPVPLTPLMALIYAFFAWVLLRKQTGQWLRGDPAPDALPATAPAGKPAAKSA
jgi:hypothetical protein